ncbi:MAG: RDD family protein [Sedimenticola sp.]
MTADKNPNTITAEPAGLLRRLGALLYDSLLIGGLLMLASIIITVPTEMLLGAETSAKVSKTLLAWLWLLIPLFFFTWFWSRGGQTLGMRAWRLRVVCEDGTALDGKKALIRALCAVLSWLPLGLGFLWSLFDPENRAWHDRLSGTRLVVLPKE